MAALHPKVRGRGTGCHCRGPAGDGVWRLGQSCGLSPDLGLGYGGPESSGAPSTGPHCSLSVLSVTPGPARTLALAPRHRAAPASFGTCLEGSVASLGMLSPLITEGLHLSQRPRLVSGTGIERAGKYDALRGGAGGDRAGSVCRPPPPRSWHDSCALGPDLQGCVGSSERGTQDACTQKPRHPLPPTAPEATPTRSRPPFALYFRQSLEAPGAPAWTLATVSGVPGS